MSTSSRCTSEKVIGLGRADEHVAVEAEILLDVFAMMRVIPVDPSILEEHAVLERAAGGYRVLRHPWNAVVAVFEAHAVPVHGGRPLGRVREVHRDRAFFIDRDERAWVLDR